MGVCSFISSPEGAKLCLGDIGFPASKEEVLEHIDTSGGPEAVTVAANRLPDKVYASLEELMQEFAAIDAASQT